MTNKVNEMVLGFAAVFFMSLVSIGAKAETVINYDDGSTYTQSRSSPGFCTRKNVSLFFISCLLNRELLGVLM